MTEEKICPTMSRPVSIPFRNGYGESTSEHLIEIECKKERCMAWVSEHIEQIPGDERYFGRDARTIKYPARCALIITAGWGVEDE